MTTSQLVAPSLPLSLSSIASEQFARLYLYGTTEPVNTTPSDLNDRLRPYVSDSQKAALQLDNSTGLYDIVVEVDEAAFMSGPGRQGNVGQLPAVEWFFYSDPISLGNDVYRYVIETDIIDGSPLKWIDVKDGDARSLTELNERVGDEAGAVAAANIAIIIRSDPDDAVRVLEAGLSRTVTGNNGPHAPDFGKKRPDYPDVSADAPGRRDRSSSSRI